MLRSAIVQVDQNTLLSVVSIIVSQNGIIRKIEAVQEGTYLVLYISPFKIHLIGEVY